MRSAQMHIRFREKPLQAAIHEMRNHLSVAMASIEAFLDRKLEPSDARLHAMFETLREIDLLIDDLPSNVTVAFGTHVVSIDVCRLVAGHVAAMEGYAAERGVRLTIESCEGTHPECAQFLGDPIRIAEIVTNLLLNAIRFTPSGGEVHVYCRRGPNDMRFTISDEGPGIRREERMHIFERGYRGSSGASFPGSGIGLALVKEFVNRQGGSIDVADGPLGGAAITVILPGKLYEGRCRECGTTVSPNLALA